ncbi:MAG: hypothetical protein GXO17_04225, partial [Thermodesulfobacteria bacterium]|nr:hypothetical protein [Thermodesulfobacteriota bacterium]
MPNKNQNNSNNNDEQKKIEPKVTKFKSNRERVRALLSQFKKEDRVLIMIWADPDAMASALAMKRLI